MLSPPGSSNLQGDTPEVFCCLWSVPNSEMFSLRWQHGAVHFHTAFFIPGKAGARCSSVEAFVCKSGVLPGRTLSPGKSWCFIFRESLGMKEAPEALSSCGFASVCVGDCTGLRELWMTGFSCPAASIAAFPEKHGLELNLNYPQCSLLLRSLAKCRLCQVFGSCLEQPEEEAAGSSLSLIHWLRFSGPSWFVR